MKTALIVVLACFAAWRAAKRRTEIDAWARSRVAALIRRSTPAQWPEEQA